MVDVDFWNYYYLLLYLRNALRFHVSSRCCRLSPKKQYTVVFVTRAPRMNFPQVKHTNTYSPFIYTWQLNNYGFSFAV